MGCFNAPVNCTFHPGECSAVFKRTTVQTFIRSLVVRVQTVVSITAQNRNQHQSNETVQVQTTLRAAKS